MLGQATSTTGAVYGVQGTSASASGFGVYGRSTSTGSGNPAGVFGEANNANGYGVYGVNSGAGGAGVFGTNTTATGIGVFGINAGSSPAVQGTNMGTGFGVFGEASGASGPTYGVFGNIPADGSSTGVGVRGQNLNTSGGIGVQAYTAAASGRSIFATGSVFIENRSAQGSATSGTDGLIVWSNSGASGFNSSGALFTPSDRNSKMDFTTIDSRAILEKVVAIPVTTWHYKNDTQTWYMGPTAQDFHSAFGLGDRDTVIHGVNADGVALAAIQGLHAELKDRDATIADLKARLSDSDRKLAGVEVRLQAVEERIGMSKPTSANLFFGLALGLPAAAGLLAFRRRQRKA